jgi:hypothetical protein
MAARVELVETCEVLIRASGIVAVINRVDFDEALHEAPPAPTAEPAPVADDGEKASGGKRKRS